MFATNIFLLPPLLSWLKPDTIRLRFFIECAANNWKDLAIDLMLKKKRKSSLEVSQFSRFE
jgi:hypothetical protein